MPGTNYLSPSAQMSFFITNTCSLAKSTLVNKPGSGHSSFILFTESMFLGKILAIDKKLLQKPHRSSSEASRRPRQSTQISEEASQSSREKSWGSPSGIRSKQDDLFYSVAWT